MRTRRLAKVLAEFQSLDDDLGQKGAAPISAAVRQALLVEDDANESELLAGFLQIEWFRRRYGMLMAAMLWIICRSIGQPDVVLLDMQMPRCDGPVNDFGHSMTIRNTVD